MKKDYQTGAGRGGTGGRTTPKKARVDAGLAAHEAVLALPDAVTVAVADLAGELQEAGVPQLVGRSSPR